MIEIKNLHYTYPDGTKALCGVDWKIAQDEFALLIGKNGAGKSTLLMHLNGLLIPKNDTCGQIKINGMNSDKTNQRIIRKTVGIVFQNPDDMLFSPTVYEDVAFGLRNLGFEEKKVHEEVHHALLQVGMEHYEEKNPHHLSFGQKKRVSLAAVLAMRPEVIVFDEPTSHLDPRGKKEIISLICNLRCTKIISTHDLELMDIADSISIMHGGIIKYNGKKPNKSLLEEFELA